MYAKKEAAGKLDFLKQKCRPFNNEKIMKISLKFFNNII